MRRDPSVVRVYRLCTRLLPPDMSREGEGMVAAFADLWEEPGPTGRRWWVAARSLAALGVVLAMEWLEFLGIWSAPGRTGPVRRMGRGGMGMGRNIRYALRTLRKAPAFTLTAAILVAVGVGAVTTIFTLVDHVLLRPLPYPQAQRLVVLDDGSYTGPLFKEVEKLTTAEDWAAVGTDEINLVGEGDPLRLEAGFVTPRFFGLFGARAQRGRLLDPADFVQPEVTVLSAGMWRRVFGADPDVVGRVIRVDGDPVTVVGILEDGFTPPEALVGGTVDLWRPLDWSSEKLASHEYHALEIAGRRAEGEGIEAVQAEVDALMVAMASVHTNYARRDGTPRTVPVVALEEMTVRAVRTGLGLLMGAVALLLLVACANVAHLFLARGLGRSREMAVRRAVGAGTGSLAGQLLAESLLVGLIGGVMGTGLAALGIRAFLLLNPTALPRQATVSVDPKVLGFAVGVSALTSLLFGMVPALRSIRGELADELRGAGRTSTTGRGVALLRNSLVAGEVALSLVLVAGAALLLRSFMTVRGQDPGFDVAGVWVVPLNLQEPDGPDAYRAVMDEITRRAAQIPGVRDAAYGLTAPMDRTGGSLCCWRTTPEVAGRDEGDRSLTSMVHPVSQSYFDVLGIELVAGRAWTPGESQAEPEPLVVNETLAREMAGSVEGAVGTTLTVGGQAAAVIGVARDNRHYGLDQPLGNAVYLPMEQLPFGLPIASLIVRADPAVASAIPGALREAVWAAAPGTPVSVVRSMRESMDRSTAGRRFDWVIFATFGGVALLLAAGGLYGTLLYVAGQRKRELGIRLALGASRGRIEAQVLRGGVALGLTGVLLGLGGAWMANRLLESRIWGVERGDPVALGGAALLLFATAVLASWLPARRAGKVDPLETLRIE